MGYALLNIFPTNEHLLMVLENETLKKGPENLTITLDNKGIFVNTVRQQ